MGLIPGSYIDIKPDPSLLNANFDGYKLSLDPFPIYSHPLEEPVQELQTSNAQYGFEHIKLFNDISYLTYDLHSSDSGHRRFVTILQNFHLCSFTFDIQTRKFVFGKNHTVIAGPFDKEEIQDRYPPTVSFPSADHAFVSNGFGRLTMYITGDRRSLTAWEECLSVEPLIAGGEVNSFVIVESRYMSNKFDVLLRSVVCSKRSSSQGNFSSKIVWLTVSSDNGKMTITDIRSIICTGHTEMVTFDNFPEGLIIVSTGDLIFCANGIDAPDTTKQEVEKECDIETAKLTKKRYAWSQTGTDVSAVFSCDETISKKDVSLSLSPTSIHLSVKDVILIGGALGGSIDPASSTYTIDDNRLELFLVKSGGDLINWSELVLNDDQGMYEIDPESLISASETLDLFTSELQTVNNRETDRNFNTEQTEDCDISTTETCKIRWLNCTAQKLNHESDISTYNVLFSVPLDSGPRFLCIRMDVDGILWKFTEESKKVHHHATFNAFGYVQASKTQRKFSACPANCSYAVIVEAKRHAFVYWQPSTTNSDLRNRKTGRRVAGVAKQHLISLCKPSEYCNTNAATENIVGIHADNEFLFILTTTDIFAVALKGSQL